MPPIKLDGSANCEVVLSTDFDSWWATLSKEVKPGLEEVITMLELGGHTLTKPWSKPIKGDTGTLRSPKELRKTVDDVPYRLLYVFHDRKAILLAGDYKTGNEDRFVRELVAKGERAFSGYLRELEEKEAAAREQERKSGGKVVKLLPRKK